MRVGFTATQTPLALYLTLTDKSGASSARHQPPGDDPRSRDRRVPTVVRDRPTGRSCIASQATQPSWTPATPPPPSCASAASRPGPCVRMQRARVSRNVATLGDPPGTQEFRSASARREALDRAAARYAPQWQTVWSATAAQRSSRGCSGAAQRGQQPPPAAVGGEAEDVLQR